MRWKEKKSEIQKKQVDVEMDPPILIMKNKTNETWLIQNNNSNIGFECVV